jgi:probable phosphoglycerate mutase
MNTTQLEQESISTTVARIYLIRHGETDENRNGVIQGQLDTALNEDGIEQARLVGNALQSVLFDRAYSSDLRRASDVGFPSKERQ